MEFFIITIFLVICIGYYLYGFSWTLKTVSGFYTDNQFKKTRLVCMLSNIIFIIVVVLIGFLGENQFNNQYYLRLFLVLLFIDVVHILVSQWVHIYAYIKRKENLSINIKLTISEHIKDKTQEDLLQLCYSENRFIYSYKEIDRMFNKVLHQERR